MTYEMIAGYLRGFGISMVPAVLTMLGVCGVRIVWVYTAFAANRTFDTLLLAYPLSLAVTAARCWARCFSTVRQQSWQRKTLR